MDNFLKAIGYWNFFGSLVMIGFFNKTFGKKMLNEWTKIFSTEFELNYWSKFWLAWAIGLNIFFGLTNIMAVKWGFAEVKIFLIFCDLVAYISFFLLAIWGKIAGRTSTGIYSVFVIFLFWIIWAMLLFF